MVNRGTFTIDHMAVVYFSSNMEYANKIRELIKSKKRINMRDVTLFENSELAKDGRKSMDSVLVALIIDTRNMLDKLTKQGIIVQKEDGYDCIRRVVHKKIKQNKEFSFIVYSILNSNCIHGINIVEKYENK